MLLLGWLLLCNEDASKPRKCSFEGNAHFVLPPKVSEVSPKVSEKLQQPMVLLSTLCFVGSITPMKAKKTKETARVPRSV